MLEIKEINKNYGDKEVLKNLSLKLNENEIYGLIGQNGAGKTTLMNILGTLVNPESGDIVLNNKSYLSQKKEYKKHIGIIPQEIALFNKLSIMDNLLYWGGISGIKRKDIYVSSYNFLKLYGLYNRRNEKVQTLSGGMKRYVSIIATMIQNPKILLLDEPTVGIDPTQRKKILDAIHKLKDNGCSIIFSTHYLEEAEKICDRIGIIIDGNIKIEGTSEEIKSKYGQGEKIIITTSDPVENLDFGNSQISVERNQVSFLSNDLNTRLMSAINLIQKKGLNIIKIEIIPSSLEWIFLNQIENNKML